ncbi:hypothetical protein HPB47_005361 [Ixodes persulcatus]|uniref:Uncharacterized protein n=1 Tax=Ixodes persulcatus TaxID=34615 RepID=A0AC60PD56_IXOPE|nr:hypothetical protein HPB47_005361 [Ixodes persulcatus]
MFLPVANGREEIAPVPPFHRFRCSATWCRLKKGRKFLPHVRGDSSGRTAAAAVREAALSVQTRSNLLIFKTFRQTAMTKVLQLESLSIGDYLRRCSLSRGPGRLLQGKYLTDNLIAPGHTIITARMMGRTETALITYEGSYVPRTVLYCQAEYRCYPHRPKAQQCTLCQRLGHRADVCPQAPTTRICPTCSADITNIPPTQPHECSPSCLNCGEEHPSTCPTCPARVKADAKAVQAAYKQRLQARRAERPSSRPSSPSPQRQAKLTHTRGRAPSKPAGLLYPQTAAEPGPHQFQGSHHRAPPDTPASTPASHPVQKSQHTQGKPAAPAFPTCSSPPRYLYRRLPGGPSNSAHTATHAITHTIAVYNRFSSIDTCPRAHGLNYPSMPIPERQTPTHQQRRTHLEQQRLSRRLLPPPPASFSRTDASIIRRAQTDTLPSPHFTHLFTQARGSPMCPHIGGYPNIPHTYWYCSHAPSPPSFPNPPSSWQEWLAPPPDRVEQFFEALVAHVKRVIEAEGLEKSSTPPLP